MQATAVQWCTTKPPSSTAIGKQYAKDTSVVLRKRLSTKSAPVLLDENAHETQILADCVVPEQSLHRLKQFCAEHHRRMETASEPTAGMLCNTVKAGEGMLYTFRDELRRM